MRNDIMWATSGGPIIGEIRHGKRYDSGNVTSEKYAADMAGIDDSLIALNQAVIECQGAAVLAGTKIDELAAKYNAAVPGMAEDIMALKLDVNNIKNAATTTAEAIARLETKEAGDIQGVTQAISTITGNINAVSEIVTANSNSIKLTDREVTQLKSTVSAISTALSANTASLAELSNDITEVESNIRVEISTSVAALNQKIDAVNAEITVLKAAVNSIEDVVSGNTNSIRNLDREYAQLNSAVESLGNTVSRNTGRITELSNELAETKTDFNAQITENVSEINQKISTVNADVTVLKAAVTDLQNVKTDVKTVENRMRDYEVTQSALRNQLLNSTTQLNERIDLLSDSAAVMRADIKETDRNLAALSMSTAESIAVINQRLNDMEGVTSVEIVEFTASPNICEIGGTENIVLNWSLSGEAASQKINGAAVTGTQKTMSNVKNPITYELVVTGNKGQSDVKKVDIKFINHIYYGVSAAEMASESIVKGLEKDVFTEEISRSVTLKPHDQYIYYAYPKRLGDAVFKVNGFQGGFENPAIVPVKNHSEYSEDYYVYRSTRILSVTTENPSVTINVKGM